MDHRVDGEWRHDQDLHLKILQGADESVRVEYLLTMHVTEPDVSVVVCTRNRSGDLVNACEAILRAEFEPKRWEMLIVDNASTDDTLEVARAVAARFPDRVRVIVEQEIGLSAARNAGIAATNGATVVFVDDDAFPEADWLAALVEGFHHEDVMCVGGPVRPRFQGELPDWFLGRYLPYLTVWDLGRETIELTYNEYPRGTNIAYRREIFEQVGTFCGHLGRKGRSLLSCEEIELCLRIERAGFKNLYVPKARVEHLTRVDRITPDWLVRRFGAQGRSEAIVNWRHGRFGGLAIGLRALYRNWRAARNGNDRSDKLFSRCQFRAFAMYALEMPRAIMMVRPYAPLQSGVPAARWRPFG